MDSRASNIIEE